MSRKRGHWRKGRGAGRPFEEIVGFLRQRNIADGNIERLRLHAVSGDPQVGALAGLALPFAHKFAIADGVAPRARLTGRATFQSPETGRSNVLRRQESRRSGANADVLGQNCGASAGLALEIARVKPRSKRRVQ